MADMPLVWIDCEMTGLNPDTDQILEVFCLVTDGQLNVLDQTGWGAIIHCEPEVLARMDDWCTRTHAASGLSDLCASPTTSMPAAAAATALLAYVRSLVPEPGCALLAGNSIGQDRAFLRKGPWAAVLEHLHYRVLDVSSLKEAARRWCRVEREDEGGGGGRSEDAESASTSAPGRSSGSAVFRKAPGKKACHRAKDDIWESIEEARYYKKAIFEGR